MRCECAQSSLICGRDIAVVFVIGLKRRKSNLCRLFVFHLPKDDVWREEAFGLIYWGHSAEFKRLETFWYDKRMISYQGCEELEELNCISIFRIVWDGGCAHLDEYSEESNVLAEWNILWLPRISFDQKNQNLYLRVKNFIFILIIP